jgi:hypothetical protein
MKKITIKICQQCPYFNESENDPKYSWCSHQKRIAEARLKDFTGKSLDKKCPLTDN